MWRPDRPRGETTKETALKRFSPSFDKLQGFAFKCPIQTPTQPLGPNRAISNQSCPKLPIFIPDQTWWLKNDFTKLSGLLHHGKLQPCLWANRKTRDIEQRRNLFLGPNHVQTYNCRMRFEGAQPLHVTASSWARMRLLNSKDVGHLGIQDVCMLYNRLDLLAHYQICSSQIVSNYIIRASQYTSLTMFVLFK